MKGKVFFTWLISTLGLYLIHSFLAEILGVLVINKGVSFGIESGLVGVSVILCGLILWWAIRENKLYLWVLLAGGWSNLIDRFLFGSVRDYWKIANTTIYNNINDWIIVLAVLILLKEILWKKKLK